MTKLIVVIPAYNEEQTVGEVVRSVPRVIPGVDRLQVLVYDDGSTDRTVEEAQRAGADYVLRHGKNRGLAVTFRDALDAALQLGADCIVNTDADNHYDQSRIPDLVEPVVRSQADIVVGSRALGALQDMGFARKWGNRIANWTFSFLYRLPEGTDVSSGFRAYSREAALRLTITSKYTYAHESLIVAKDHNLVIVNKIFPARDVARPSRLMSGVGAHIYRAGSVAVLSFAVHRLFHILMGTAALLMLAGSAAFIRFLYLFATSGGGGHIQSLIIGAVLVILGMQVIMGSFFGLALAKNRQLTEDIIYMQRRQMFEARWSLPEPAEALEVGPGEPEPASVRAKH
ncbi:MAG: glycosyltransferase family 2 protein [Chloroflexi bacterium]|nr:glycosyltransferase family 2 protein [Chloroflexota bacterium]